jgi:hypothetical protein
LLQKFLELASNRSRFGNGLLTILSSGISSPWRSIGIIVLAAKVHLISGLQWVTGKILKTNSFARRYAAHTVPRDPLALIIGFGSCGSQGQMSQMLRFI